MPEQEINLGQLVGKDHKYELSVSSESAEDATARRAKEAAEAGLNRRMRFTLFLFALVLAAVVFAGCVFVFAAGSPEDRKWAAGIVSAMVSGLIGFLVGQGKK